MLRATIKSLLARKLRLLLSGLAVLLGVSFVTGTLVLTDSLGVVFDRLFTTINAGTAVGVRGTSPFGALDATADRAPVPQAVLDRIRQVDGVTEARGNVSGFAQVVGRDGKPVSTGGAPSLAVDIAPGSRQESLRVKQGRAPTGDGEVAIDAITASKSKLLVGDTIQVLLKGPARRFQLVGIVGFATTDNIAGASLVAFPVEAAQRYAGTPGSYTQLAVAGANGISQAELRSRIARVLPKGFEAVTSAQSINESSAQVKKGLGFFSTALLVFAGISLFVGAFLIFNTFSMLVAQRTRELALMRALGASRGQVTRSVLLEALVVGVVSSVAGFAIGIAVASGLRALLDLLGIPLPNGPTVIAGRTIVAAIVVGVGVTATAALIPARRAARVSPVEAMRDSGPAEDRSLRRRGLVGGGLLLVGVLALAQGLSNGTLPLVGLGAVLAFIGVATLSPFVARPVTSLLGAPFARLGVPGRLGRGNAVRSPRRTSATAAALMVGLALVSAVSVLGASLKKSVEAIVQSSLGADYVLSTERFEPFGPQVADALRGKPGIAAVASFTQGSAAIKGRTGGAGRVSIQGVDPVALAQTLRLTAVDGDLAALARGELVMSADVAKSQGLRVGQQVPVTWARTGATSLRLGATYATNQFAGGYLVSKAVFDANTSVHDPLVVAVRAAPGASPADTRAIVDAAVRPFPNIRVQDRSQFVQAQGRQVDQLLNAVNGLLVLSVLIAVLGIINTLALSVVERVRELGLLRAVGLQRRQLRRMIRVESVIIAVYGALLGLVLGTAFGYALVNALHDQGVTEFSVPIGRLLLLVVFAAIAGVLAAALPARRAARLDVLAAVATT